MLLSQKLCSEIGRPLLFKLNDSKAVVSGGLINTDVAKWVIKKNLDISNTFCCMKETTGFYDYFVINVD